MKANSSILPARCRCAQALMLCVVVLISACETPGARNTPAGLQQRAEAQAEAGNFSAAAQLYERLAASASGAPRNRYLMAAAEAWYEADERARALHDMRAVQRPFGNALSPVQTLLAAVIEVESGAPRDALARLARLPEDTPRQLSADALAVGAQAWFRQGNTRRGVESLLERELWLDSSDRILANQRLIWEGLRAAGRVDIPSDADESLAGWLALGNAVAETAGDPFAERAALLGWRKSWPQHPGADILLRQLLDDSGDAMSVPQRVALLLPVSGRLAGAGTALRDGFIAAYFDYGEATGEMQIVVYDTESLGAAQAYRSAAQEGAEFVVGPLLKDNVIEVAGLAVAGPPTLALNYLPDETRAPSTFFQFALAPEHEARRVAQRAMAEGQYNAVALVPGNDWGQRILDAFGHELESLGGTLLTHQVYDPSATDFSATIRPMLHLDRSRARHRALAAALGRTLEFEPRRRQDVDFIFIAAVARQARLIRPQLRFHYATDLPVYATAAAFDPNPDLNRDLDGLMFAATPWEIAASPKAKSLQTQIERNWPDKAQHRTSLFAMGYDAWRLAPLLTQRSELPLALQGLTGDLTLTGDGRIERAPGLARIQQGLATPMDDLALPDDGPGTIISTTATGSAAKP